MMKTVIASLFLMTMTTTIAYADLVAGQLVADDYECSSDHMVFATTSGFTNAEWYGGFLHEGTVYFAEFESFGFTDVYDSGGNEVGRIWIDDYWVSQADASRFCYKG